MRHECGNCLGEFFDDAPSSNPPERVFCVFCGAPVLPPLSERASAVPFSADFPREDGFALGVIGRASSEFPDTLKQFRAHGAGAITADSLSPLQTEPEPSSIERDLPPWRLRRFWMSLAVGFGVGAIGAAVFGQQRSASAPRAAASTAPLEKAVAPATAPLALSGCPVVSAAPVTPAALPAPTSRPQVTPVLERRFWLERARTAQREYHLVDAERFYRRVLSLAPRDSEALVGVGEIELLRGAPPAAEAHFQAALDANSQYVPALVALADLKWQAGQVEEARAQYRSIVEQYAADLYPPYVNQRLEAAACAPRCE